MLATKVQVSGAFPASHPGMPQSGLTVQVPPVFSEKPLTGFIHRIWYDPREAAAEVLASFLTSFCSSHRQGAALPGGFRASLNGII